MNYIEIIRRNIKDLFLKGEISKRYSFDSFCNNFIPGEKLIIQEKDNCICGHKIKNNFKYKHKNREDYFILGSCCIKKYSEHYKNDRKCKKCSCQIRAGSIYCKKCKYENKCKCKICGYQKKDDKYKYCYLCFKKTQL